VVPRKFQPASHVVVIESASLIPHRLPLFVHGIFFVFEDSLETVGK
jgi:hypothetical protein